HEPQRRIDDCSRLLGVEELLHQLHRALDVGKQRRHRLALTFGSLVRFERWSLVYGRVPQTNRRDRNPGLRRRPKLKGRAAFLAESRFRWIVKTTFNAGRFEGSSALNAKFRGRLILGSAARTAHFPQRSKQRAQSTTSTIGKAMSSAVTTNW